MIQLFNLKICLMYSAFELNLVIANLWKTFTVPLENKLKSGAYNDTVNITHYVIQSNSSVLLGNCNCLHVHTSIWSLCKLQDEYIQKINYDLLHTDLTLLPPPPPLLL